MCLCVVICGALNAVGMLLWCAKTVLYLRLTATVTVPGQLEGGCCDTDYHDVSDFAPAT